MKKFYVNEEDKCENTQSTMLTAGELCSDILEGWNVWYKNERKILTVKDAVEAVESYLDCNFFRYGEIDNESVDALAHMFASEFDVIDEVEMPDFMIERTLKSLLWMMNTNST